METLSPQTPPVQSQKQKHTHTLASVKLTVFPEQAHKELPGYGKVFFPHISSQLDGGQRQEATLEGTTNTGRK